MDGDRRLQVNLLAWKQRGEEVEVGGGGGGGWQSQPAHCLAGCPLEGNLLLLLLLLLPPPLAK